VQLRGALEYGIAVGELPAGARLPSVRALAARLGLSPVTVSNVYAALQSAGHAEGRVGDGTFVSKGVTAAPATALSALDRGIADLLRLARRCGLGQAELAMRVSMAPGSDPAGLRVLLVGSFHGATEAYAADLRPLLPAGCTVTAMTLDRLADGEATGGDPGADLVVAPRTLVPRVRDLFPNHPVAGLTLIPNEATRVALAAIPPEARVVAHSHVPGFVAIMKAGIARFAPHVTDLTMTVPGALGAAEAISRADVVIYASGSELPVRGTAPGATAFEYRHTPDVQAVRAELLPLLEACSARTAETKEPAT
jgi:GntR family transcriptional regulator